jgi:hypothetical protein
MYDYGHGEPAVIERHAEVGGPWLTVRLPASTRVKLILRLAMRARRPSYASPFDDSGTADLPQPTLRARPPRWGGGRAVSRCWVQHWLRD